MIAAWIIYTVLVGGLLYVAGRAAEFVCRTLGAATRFVWAALLCAAIGLSANALVRMGTRTLEVTGIVGRPTNAATIVRGNGVRTTDAPTPEQGATAMAFLASVRSSLDPSALGDLSGVDRPLSIAGLMLTLAAMAYLFVALRRVSRIARGFEAHDLDGHRVLLSDHVGPALIGIARPRLVVPRWVLSLDEADRHAILVHEQQHARAADPALAAGAALLVALEPWNIAIWGMFARLRLAIEADCDARVVCSSADRRRYGALLLTVYERTIADRAPSLAFVERRSHLEERIRRLARRVPRLRSPQGIAAALASIVFVGAACEATAPSKGARDAALKQSALITPAVSVVGVEPACLQSASAAISRTDSDGVRRPSMSQLIALVRSHRPDVVASRDAKPRVLGILLNENCVIRRDTIIENASRGLDDALLAATFGDTLGFTPYRGMGYFSTMYGGPLTVIFAVQPSEPWRERVAYTECGFGIRSDEHCGASGPLVFRMVDSVRALIAVRRFRAPNQPAENLFLVTLARPYPALTSRSMVHALVAYQSGAVYIEDFGATQPLWLFAPSSSNGLASLKRKRDVQVFTDLVGVAHYNAGWLTLEQIDRLTPAKTCNGPKGACWEVDGHQLQFPG